MGGGEGPENPTTGSVRSGGDESRESREVGVQKWRERNDQSGLNARAGHDRGVKAA